MLASIALSTVEAAFTPPVIDRQVSKANSHPQHFKRVFLGGKDVTLTVEDKLGPARQEPGFYIQVLAGALQPLLVLGKSARRATPGWAAANRSSVPSSLSLRSVKR